MFASNESPIQNVSPRALLSTTPPDEYVENGPRSSLESIEPLNDQAAKTPIVNFPRRRANSSGHHRTKKCCFGICCCPYMHVSLTRHFRRCAILLVFCAILNMILCSYYAYMDSNQKFYEADPTKYWQSCIVFAEFTPQAGFNTHFSLSAAAAGQQTLIFSMLSAVTMYRALAHPEWIVSTLVFVFYSGIGCICFFSFSPAIPFPSNLTANVLTLMMFVKPSMYDDVTFSDENLNRRKGDDATVELCKSAYNYNLTFLFVQYISIALVGCLFVIGVLAESRRRRVGLINNDRTQASGGGHRTNPSATLAGFSFANWPTLHGTNSPMLMSIIAFLGFFIMLYGKNAAAITALDCVRDLNDDFSNFVPQTFFPFSAGGLDIVTILFVVSAMAIIRGTTRQRVSAFRLAASASFLHIVLSYPSVISGWKFSTMNNFWNSKCEDYFASNSMWFYPLSSNQSSYCTAVRLSMVGQLITFVAMHGAVFTSVRCYLKNKDHPLELFDPNPPSEARALLFSDNVIRQAS